MRNFGHKILMTKFAGGFKANDAVVDLANRPAHVVAIASLPALYYVPIIYDDHNEHNVYFLRHDGLMLREKNTFVMKKVSFDTGLRVGDKVIYKGESATVADWEFPIADNEVPIRLDRKPTIRLIVGGLSLLKVLSCVEEEIKNIPPSKSDKK
ncbi:MAG: hypothetical protein Q8O88_05505 [bacterium]|nr:hypothetical protein [bacterium]